MRAALLLLPAALLGCDDVQQSEHNAYICGPIEARPVQIPDSLSSQIYATSTCVENWAVRLSRSDERVETVVDAAIAACQDGYSAMVQFGGDAGLRDTIEAQRRLDREQALFRVVQWRAGSCELPEEKL